MSLTLTLHTSNLVTIMIIQYLKILPHAQHPRNKVKPHGLSEKGLLELKK